MYIHTYCGVYIYTRHIYIYMTVKDPKHPPLGAAPQEVERYPVEGRRLPMAPRAAAEFHPGRGL